MRLITRIAALSLAFVLVIASQTGIAQESSAYVPEEGDEVVVYTHRFNAEDFDEAKKVVEEGFTEAAATMGQVRHNVFIVNPTNYEIVAISFFSKGESVDDWHKFMGRLDVLEKLEPMRREPIVIQRYQVDRIINTK